MTENNRQNQPWFEDKIITLAINNRDIIAMWLYGSYAKGTAVEHSDIDLAILFNNPQNVSQVDAEELAIQWQRQLNVSESKLSVVDIVHAPIGLAFNIIESGKVLMCKNYPAMLKQIQGIYSKFEYAEKEREYA